jgi:phage shock protein C
MRSGRIYRDRENGLILGVCAGIAEYLELPVLAIRAAALVALWFAFTPVLLVYVTAGILLPDLPLRHLGREREHRFWRSGCYGR